MKACNLKKGNIVQINNTPYQVKHIDVQTPSARGANTLYKVRYSSIPGGQKLDQSYRGNDMLEEMELVRRSVNFLYNDQDTYNFMDNHNYEQYAIPIETIQINFASFMPLKDRMQFATSMATSPSSILNLYLGVTQNDIGKNWLTDGLEGITVLLFDENPICIELPASVTHGNCRNRACNQRCDRNQPEQTGHPC